MTVRSPGAQTLLTDLIMIEYLNFYYFLYIALALALLAGLYFLLRNKGKRVGTLVLFGLLFASFALHFLKLTFGEYQRWMPRAVMTITPENICAVSVLIFPWLFLSGKDLLKDYMFYFGLLSGLGATVVPVDIIGRGAFEFEVIRFYFCHIIIWVVPLLMVMLKLHTLDYKRIFKVPFMFYLVLCVILANEVMLTGAGFIHIDYLFNSSIRNAAMIFGPHPEVAPLGRLFLALTPKLFQTVPVGPNAGAVFYWPVIWLIIPAYICFCVFALAISIPRQHRVMKEDVSRLIKRLNR